jgi:hypothetical protein
MYHIVTFWRIACMGATYLIVALLRIVPGPYSQCSNEVRGTYAEKHSICWQSGFQLSGLKPTSCQIGHGKIQLCELCDTWHPKHPE